MSLILLRMQDQDQGAGSEVRMIGACKEQAERAQGKKPKSFLKA